MTHPAPRPRWAAPPHAYAHPRLALVSYAGRLFSYAQLIDMLPPDIRGQHATAPQQSWDRLAALHPAAAGLAASRCRPLDFDVLDLYAAEAAGTA